MSVPPVKSVLITGAIGLVGRSLCAFLEQSGCIVTRAVRSSTTSEDIPVGNIDSNTNWKPALSSSPEAIVHLAARVHQAQSEDRKATALYWQINTRGTLNLARQCADAGVKRFVFVSTIKVLGEGNNQPYHADDSAIPVGPYAQSKWEAEQGLLEIGAQTGMQIVILRPPLVYGPGVKANFLRMMQTIERGLPLPLGAIENRRSLIYLGNLVHAIATCISHPAAAGKTYLVSDGEDVSTPELIRRIAAALERPARLLPIPPAWLQYGGRLLGKGEAMERLLSSLYVDSHPIREELDWTPPYTMEVGLAATAQWYRGMSAKTKPK